MRGGIVPWVAAFASVASGCAQAPGGSAEGGGDDGSCSSLRVYIDSPAADEVSGTWSTQVVGRVESAAEIRNLYYEVEGTTIGFPAAAGPFSFTVEADRRSKVRVAVLARTVDGCVANVERMIHFDTTRWIDLIEGVAGTEATVAAPGEELVVHWKATTNEPVKAAPRMIELLSGRQIPLKTSGPSKGEGSATITVQNEDLEIWRLDLGSDRSSPHLSISVGPTLQMIPAQIQLVVGESQWISIPNARHAVWTVEPAAVLEPEWGLLPFTGGSVRAGARFEAQQPGTYKVRASSEGGERMGEVQLEVKTIEQPSVTIGDLPSFPEGFNAFAVAALPDATLVAGGRFDAEIGLVRLPRGANAWTPFGDFGAKRGTITHLVVGERGNLYALAAVVYRISAEGEVERILDRDQVEHPIASIWKADGTLFASVGFDQTYAFDPAAGAWAKASLHGACSNTAATSDEHGIWHACMGVDRLWGPDFLVLSLAPIFDLAMDDAGLLLAATARGVHRLSGAKTWEQMAGGGPAGPGTVLLRSGQGLFAGNQSGLWGLVRSSQAWVRLPISLPEPWPFFVAMPDGGIVVGQFASSGSDIVEISVVD